MAIINSSLAGRMAVIGREDGEKKPGRPAGKGYQNLLIGVRLGFAPIRPPPVEAWQKPMMTAIFILSELVNMTVIHT